MPAQADLVHETSVTTGTGNFTTVAVNGKQRFSDAGAFGTGATTNVFDYYISNRDVAGEWEHGTGHMSAAGTLVRDTVIAGSNGTSAVNFSAGTKDITNDVPASQQIRAYVTSKGDTAYTLVATDYDVITSAAFTAPRTWTLPAANAVAAGRRVRAIDAAGGVTATNTLTIARAGADTINGASTSFTINKAYGWVELESDGTSKWTIVGTNIQLQISNNTVVGNNTGATGPGIEIAADALATLIRTGTGASGVLQSKYISLTRDTSLASGSVAYTGVGFKPTALIFCISDGANRMSVGFIDAAKSGISLSPWTAGYANWAALSGIGAYVVDGTAANHATASVASFDADGFTLSWVKTGSPTGTQTVYVLCLR
jgi:hypothetical protein